jgi:hypothetical protein
MKQDRLITDRIKQIIAAYSYNDIPNFLGTTALLYDPSHKRAFLKDYIPSDYKEGKTGTGLKLAKVALDDITAEFPSIPIKAVTGYATPFFNISNSSTHNFLVIDFEDGQWVVDPSFKVVSPNHSYQVLSDIVDYSLLEKSGLVIENNDVFPLTLTAQGGILRFGVRFQNNTIELLLSTMEKDGAEYRDYSCAKNHQRGAVTMMRNPSHPLEDKVYELVAKSSAQSHQFWR